MVELRLQFLKRVSNIARNCACGDEVTNTRHRVSTERFYKKTKVPIQKILYVPIYIIIYSQQLETSTTISRFMYGEASGGGRYSKMLISFIDHPSFFYQQKTIEKKIRPTSKTELSVKLEIPTEKRSLECELQNKSYWMWHISENLFHLKRRDYRKSIAFTWDKSVSKNRSFVYDEATRWTHDTVQKKYTRLLSIQIVSHELTKASITQ